MMFSSCGLNRPPVLDTASLPCDDDYYELEEDERDGWENRAEEVNKEAASGALWHSGFSLWKEDSGEYDRFRDILEKWNNDVESYLRDIDLQYGTDYAPSGATRLPSEIGVVKEEDVNYMSDEKRVVIISDKERDISEDPKVVWIKADSSSIDDFKKFAAPGIRMNPEEIYLDTKDEKILEEIRKHAPGIKVEFYEREESQQEKKPYKISKDTVEVFTVFGEIANLSKKEKLEIVKEYFRKEYQGKSVSYTIEGEGINAVIDRHTRNKFYMRGAYEKNRQYITRINIGASNEFMTLIENAQINYSSDERKRSQNERHSATEKYHYFIKPIMCDDEYYRVNVAVQEFKNGKMAVYSVTLTDLGDAFEIEKDGVNASVETTDYNVHSINESIAEDISNVNTPEEIISAFRNKTDELFNTEHTVPEAFAIEQDVASWVQNHLDETGNENNIKVGDPILIGSRSRGIEKVASDLDILLPYTGDAPEDWLFEFCNTGDEFDYEDDKDSPYYLNKHRIDGIKVDINPIKIDDLNDLTPVAQHLINDEKYMEEKAKEPVSYNDIVYRAMGVGHGDERLAARDNAQGKIRNLMIERGYPDPEGDPVFEDSINDFIKEEGQELLFNKNGWLVVEQEEQKESSRQMDNDSVFGKGNWGIEEYKEYDDEGYLPSYRVYHLDNERRTIAYGASLEEAKQQAIERGIDLYVGSIVHTWDGNNRLNHFIPDPNFPQFPGGKVTEDVAEYTAEKDEGFTLYFYDKQTDDGFITDILNKHKINDMECFFQDGDLYLKDDDITLKNEEVFSFLSDEVFVYTDNKPDLLTDGEYGRFKELEEYFKTDISEYLNIELTDDISESGGTSFRGETVKDFALDIGYDEHTSLYKLNRALEENGIKKISLSGDPIDIVDQKMKASEFAEFFDFYLDFNENKDEEAKYQVTDNQGVFHTRYIDRVEELADCFDSMLADYVETTLEEHGFEYIGNYRRFDRAASNPGGLDYYTQAKRWIENEDRYAPKDSHGSLYGTDTYKVICCLVDPNNIIDDVGLQMEKEKTMTVVLCKPGEIAKVVEVGTSLKDMQEAVGGLIEAVYPFKDEVAIVCNEEGKINGSRPSRGLFNDEGRLIDVLYGNFFICGLGKEDFKSLDNDLIIKYQEIFRYPENYLREENELRVISYNPVDGNIISVKEDTAVYEAESDIEKDRIDEKIENIEKLYNFDDIYETAEDAAHLSPELKRKDEALFQLASYLEENGFMSLTTDDDGWEDEMESVIGAWHLLPLFSEGGSLVYLREGEQRERINELTQTTVYEITKNQYNNFYRDFNEFDFVYPKGSFIVNDAPLYTALDNLYNEFYVQSFKTLEAAVSYLDGKNPEVLHALENENAEIGSLEALSSLLGENKLNEIWEREFNAAFPDGRVEYLKQSYDDVIPARSVLEAYNFYLKDDRTDLHFRTYIEDYIREDAYWDLDYMDESLKYFINDTIIPAYEKELKAAGFDKVNLDYSELSDDLRDYHTEAMSSLWLDWVSETLPNDLHINIGISTPEEQNKDHGSINSMLCDYWGVDINTGWETAPLKDGDATEITQDCNNAFAYLIQQQGYSLGEVLCDRPQSGFAASAKYEAINFSNYMGRLTVLAEVDFDTFSKLATMQKTASLISSSEITFSKNAMLGVFNPWLGSGSCLEVQLEKPFTVPGEYITDIQIENAGNGNNGYTVDEAYGLIGSCWREGVEITENHEPQKINMIKIEEDVKALIEDAIAKENSSNKEENEMAKTKEEKKKVEEKVENKAQEKATENEERNVKDVYISLNKKFCYQIPDKWEEGKMFNTMTMPKGTTLNGEDISGCTIHPKYMNEMKDNKEMMVGHYYVPVDGTLEVNLQNDGKTIGKVDIEQLAAAVDAQKAAYRQQQKEMEKNKEASKDQDKNKEKDKGEELG